MLQFVINSVFFFFVFVTGYVQNSGLKLKPGRSELEFSMKIYFLEKNALQELNEVKIVFRTLHKILEKACSCAERWYTRVLLKKVYTRVWMYQNR